MTTEPEQPMEVTLQTDAPVAEPVPVEPDAVKVEEEEEYQPPLNGQEFREMVADSTTYVKEAWLQPFRKVVREGLDATRSFARDLSGKQRNK